MPPRKRKADGSFATWKDASEHSPESGDEQSIEPGKTATDTEEPVLDSDPLEDEDKLAQVAAASILGRLRQDDNNVRHGPAPQDLLHNTMPRLRYQLNDVPALGPIFGRLRPAGIRQRGLTQLPVLDTSPTINEQNTRLFTAAVGASPQPVQPSFLQPADRDYGGYNDPFTPPVNVINNNQSLILPFDYRQPAQSSGAGHGFAADSLNVPAFQRPWYEFGLPSVNANASSSRLLFPTPTQDEMNAALEAYNQKYLQNLQPFEAEEELLMCICLRPDDGLPYIECSNRDRCLMRWYHLNCLGFTTQTAPVGVAWYCPDCQRQQIGGAAEYQRTLAQNARMSGRPQQVWQPLRAPGPPTTAPHPTDLNPSTDAGSFHVWNSWAGPVNHRVLGSPFDGFATLANSIKPTNTTPKKPNKNSWSPYEEKALEDAVKEVFSTGLAGQPLWDAVLPKLRAKGIDRCMGAIRNRYGRGLREKTGIDERRKPNPAKMTTSQQMSKEERGALRAMRQGKNGRYAVSRVWGKAAKTPEPKDQMSSVPQAPRKKGLRMQTQQRTSEEYCESESEDEEMRED